MAGHLNNDFPKVYLPFLSNYVSTAPYIVSNKVLAEVTCSSKRNVLSTINNGAKRNLATAKYDRKTKADHLQKSNAKEVEINVQESNKNYSETEDSNQPIVIKDKTKTNNIRKMSSPSRENGKTIEEENDQNGETNIQEEKDFNSDADKGHRKFIKKSDTNEERTKKSTSYKISSLIEKNEKLETIAMKQSKRNELDDLETEADDVNQINTTKSTNVSHECEKVDSHLNTSPIRDIIKTKGYFAEKSDVYNGNEEIELEENADEVEKMSGLKAQPVKSATGNDEDKDCRMSKNIDDQNREKNSENKSSEQSVDDNETRQENTWIEDQSFLANNSVHTQISQSGSTAREILKTIYEGSYIEENNNIHTCLSTQCVSHSKNDFIETSDKCSSLDRNASADTNYVSFPISILNLSSDQQLNIAKNCCVTFQDVGNSLELAIDSSRSEGILRSPEKTRFSPNSMNLLPLSIAESFIGQLEETVSNSMDNRSDQEFERIDVNGMNQDEDYAQNNNVLYPQEDSDNDQDYVPEEDVTNYSDDSNDELDEREQSSLLIQQPLRNTSYNSSDNFDVSASANEPGMQAPDDTKLSVEHSRGPSGSGKKHCCFYCKKIISKLSRYLESVHKDRIEVKKFINLPINSKERKDIIATIRKNGDFSYNNDIKVNTGKLIVCRRPNGKFKKDATHFVICGKCKGFYSKNTLRHHVVKCTKGVSKNSRSILVMGRKISSRIHESASKLLRQMVFPVLREDEIVRLIRYDMLIISLGNKLCEKHGNYQHQHDMIRAKLRLLGRFLKEMKRLEDDVTDMASIFRPKFYKSAKEAIKKLAEFDEISSTFGRPTIVTHLFSLLKITGNRLVTIYIEQENAEKQFSAEQFLKVLTEDYGASMNKGAVDHSLQARRSKKVDLPSQEDIIKLHEFLKVKRVRAYNNLLEQYSNEDYFSLLESSLSTIQLFNRRRAGEMERMLVADFNNREDFSSTNAKELLKNLSNLSKKLVKEYTRVEIRGKLGRIVPVLIRSDIVKCLELLIYYRDRANIPPGNKYLFGLPGMDKHRYRYLRACNLLRKFSVECGASTPFTLRGTKLRKHVATACIGLNLTQSELLDLADFMGHDKEIQKKIYCQPTFQRDVLQMTQLLQKVQGDPDILNDGNSDTDSETENQQIDETGGELSNELLPSSMFYHVLKL